MYPGLHPDGLYNWTFKDVGDFLKQRGFSYFVDVEAIGAAWMNFRENGEPNCMVEVKFTQPVCNRYMPASWFK